METASYSSGETSLRTCLTIWAAVILRPDTNFSTLSRPETLSLTSEPPTSRNRMRRGTFFLVHIGLQLFRPHHACPSLSFAERSSWGNSPPKAGALAIHAFKRAGELLHPRE